MKKKPEEFQTAFVLSFHTISYLGVNFAIKLSGFLLVPVYTYYLSAEDYGALSIYDSLKIAFGFLASLCLEKAYIINVKHNVQDRNSIFLNSFAFIIALNLFLLPSISYSLYYFTDFLPESSLKLLFVVFFSQFIWQLTELFYAFWKEALQSFKAALAEFMTYFLNVSLTLYLLIVLKKGWQSQIYATIIASSLQFVLIFLFFLKKEPSLFKGKLRWGTTWPLVKTGCSVILPGCMIIIFSLVDKVVLKNNVSIQSVGYYTLASKFTLIIVIVFETILKVFEPYFYRKLKRKILPEDRRRINDVYFFFYFIVTSMFLGLSLFSRELIDFVAASEYRESYFYVIGLSPSILLYAFIRFNFSILLSFESNYKVSFLVFILFFFHLVGSYYFTKIFSHYGIFVSNFITMSFLFLCIKKRLSKFISIKVEKTPLYSGLVLSALIYALLIFQFESLESKLEVILLKIAIYSFYLIMPLIVGKTFQRILKGYLKA